MTEYHEIAFIPADWLERAAFWPGLQVHSRTVSVPIDVDCPQRRKTDRGVKKAAVKGDFALAHREAIVIDGWIVAPQMGQLIAFGVGANRRTHTIIESWLSASGEQSIILDRPLEVALADNDDAFPGPVDALNMASHRDSLTLVTRPLAVPNMTTSAVDKIERLLRAALLPNTEKTLDHLEKLLEAYDE